MKVLGGGGASKSTVVAAVDDVCGDVDVVEEVLPLLIEAEY